MILLEFLIYRLLVHFYSKISKVFWIFKVDMGILNTMDKEIQSAQVLLEKSGISLLDAARLVRNILDAFPQGSNIAPIQFCSKIIDMGKRHIRSKEMRLAEGFSLYLQTKRCLRPDSIRDIRYLGNRLIKSNSKLAECNFSEFSVSDCETWLSETFSTPSQFNKARTMLHGLFEFALRREWCARNPVKLVERRNVVEREIEPLKIAQTKKLLKTAAKPKYKECLPALGLLMFAGIRPREVCRITWGDIDLEENSITIRAICSKTGGVRQVEICPALKRLLTRNIDNRCDKKICPKNWRKKWREIREKSGFKEKWTQDVLRHTYASYHAKQFRDLPRLQLNMGHRDIALLRSRYVNMRGISSFEARAFFR